MEKWCNFFSYGLVPVGDNIIVGTTLLANLCNVYSGEEDQAYFQQELDELRLSLEQCADVIELIYISTMTVYSKRDFQQMLPIYAESLRIPPNAKVSVDNMGRCSIMVHTTDGLLQDVLTQMEIENGSTV